MTALTPDEQFAIEMVGRNGEFFVSPERIDGWKSLVDKGLIRLGMPMIDVRLTGLGEREYEKILKAKTRDEAAGHAAEGE